MTAGRAPGCAGSSGTSARAGEAAALQRARAARVPRLRLGRHRAARGRRARVRPRRRQPREPEGGRRAERLRDDDRGRPHALGHARPRLRGERPPADRLRRRRARDRPERHRRELPRAAASPSSTDGHEFTLRDRRRGRRPPRRAPLRRRPRRGRRAPRTGELEGHFAFVVIHRDHPNLLVGARLQCPLVVGVGEGEMFLASSIAAFLRETRACS